MNVSVGQCRGAAPLGSRPIRFSASKATPRRGSRLVFPKSLGVFLWLAVAIAIPAQDFVNWENQPVHGVDISPDGQMLAVVNLPDNRVELFDITTGGPVAIGAVSVGLDPVSLRFRTNAELWVVNHISDSVSVVDVATLTVTATIQTLDEPSDVVFAAGRAFVTCSQANTIQVFDPATRALIQNVAIDAEDPRALAVSSDGTEIYAAIFESGNASTILGGGANAAGLGVPLNVVNNAAGPYGGQNPPPNDGVNFKPPINGALPAPPAVGLIVKKDAAGNWMDDNGGDWTALVSGVNAALSSRPVGWDLPDRDLAIVDTTSFAVTYATGLMNLCMALAIKPGATEEVTLVGTDATNEIRFEPNIRGTFTRVNMATVDPGTLGKTLRDLNGEHLDYSVGTLAQSERDKSIGDPRGIVWNASGTRGYVTGMGSNNLIILDGGGNRAGNRRIELGEGPTSLALDEARRRLYILNRFEGSISVVDTLTEAEIARVTLHDPTAAAIKTGRKHFYDTNETSGLGQIACASCHVDTRMDRLAWDLGDPSGAMKSLAELNLGAGMPGLTGSFTQFHPMKGPMTTQTFQDIVGHEPFHWRGDRLGLEEFNPAFLSLQGDDEFLTPSEMQEFEDFLATVHFPPNPFRNFDNTLNTSVALPGFFATGRHAKAAGAPLDPGDAAQGRDLYRGVTQAAPGRRLDSNAFTCVQCHTLPTGMGTDFTLVAGTFVQIAVNPPTHPTAPGAHHVQLVSVDQSTQRAFKTPQIRNAYEKTGFSFTQLSNRAGFGFLHDGSVDSLEQFIDEPVFTIANDQELSDVVAFVLSMSGSDLPEGTTSTGSGFLDPPGPPSLDVPASVGKQVTIVDAAPVPLFGVADAIAAMIALADAAGGRVDLVVKGPIGGINRGTFYDRSTGMFRSDIDSVTIAPAALRALASASTPLTYTVVPRGMGERVGIDRDADGFGDRTEVLAGSDPTDAGSVPGGQEIDVVGGPLDFGIIGLGRTSPSLAVAVTNLGNADLLLTGISIVSTPMAEFRIFSAPSLAPMSPMEMRTVEVVFEPTVPGLQTATLQILSNDLDEPTIGVPISGIGVVITEARHWNLYE